MIFFFYGKCLTYFCFHWNHKYWIVSHADPVPESPIRFWIFTTSIKAKWEDRCWIAWPVAIFPFHYSRKFGLRHDDAWEMFIILWLAVLAWLVQFSGEPNHHMLVLLVELHIRDHLHHHHRTVRDHINGPAGFCLWFLEGPCSLNPCQLQTVTFDLPVEGGQFWFVTGQISRN